MYESTLMVMIIKHVVIYIIWTKFVANDALEMCKHCSFSL